MRWAGTTKNTSTNTNTNTDTRLSPGSCLWHSSTAVQQQHLVHTPRDQLSSCFRDFWLVPKFQSGSVLGSVLFGSVRFGSFAVAYHSLSRPDRTMSNACLGTLLDSFFLWVDDFDVRLLPTTIEHLNVEY